jgi:ribosome biogenesis GTPase A
VILVLDINDLVGSFNFDIVDNINRKNLDYFIVVNKIDTIPKNVNLNKIKSCIISNLQSLSVEKQLVNLVN